MSGITVDASASAIAIGKQEGSVGYLNVSFGGNFTAGPQLTIGDAGTGSVSVIGGATFDASNSNITIGKQQGSIGTLAVGGSNSTLSADNITVGGLIPDPSSPDNGQDGNWTYVGGIGTLDVSDGASLTSNNTLTLQGDFVADNGTVTAEGGIDFSNGGSIDIGGGGAAPANTIEIADNGSLVGHGLIDSDVTGQVTVGDSNVPTYSLNIDNSGTIEAQDGTLALNGNLTGDGQVLIDQDSTLVLGGSVGDDVTIMFMPSRDQDSQSGGDQGTQKIVIEDPEDFNGVISSENFEPGDEIDLPSVPYISPGSNDANPDGASFYFETGEDQQNYVLQVVENDQTYNIPISQDEQLSGGFTLSDDGHGGTLITYTEDAVTGYSVTATADGTPNEDHAGVVQLISGKHLATGFAVGDAGDLVLTAAHFTTDIGGLGSHVNIRFPNGALRDGTVIVQGFSNTLLAELGAQIGTTGPNDWAYIYVPSSPLLCQI